MSTRRSNVLLTLVLASAMYGTGFAQTTLGRNVMPGHIAGRIEVLLSKTKVICVGRYVIDVPETSDVVYGPASTPYPIQRYMGKANRLNEVVASVVQDALANKSKHPIGPASRPGSMVGNVIAGINERHKIVYSVEKTTGVYYSLVSVIALGDDIYVQERSHFGDPSELESIVLELKAIARRITAREDRDINLKPGFCIDGAIVGDEGVPEYESVTLGIRLKQFDDVHLSIEMSLKSELVESDALEPRLKAAEEEANLLGYGDWYARIRNFRRGERRLAGWKGYEVVARKPPQTDAIGSHEFAFVSQGEPKNPLLPVISISFFTGVKGDTVGGTAPSLSDNEAIQLWDRLTGSIRLAVSISKEPVEETRKCRM